MLFLNKQIIGYFCVVTFVQKKRIQVSEVVKNDAQTILYALQDFNLDLSQMLNEAPGFRISNNHRRFPWFVVISFKLLKSNIASGKMHL